MALSSGLQLLTPGFQCTQNLQDVALPVACEAWLLAKLQSEPAMQGGSTKWTPELDFSLKLQAEPGHDGSANGLQSVTVGFKFNQSLHNVALPSALQTRLGQAFDQSLGKVALPIGLQNDLCLHVQSDTRQGSSAKRHVELGFGDAFPADLEIGASSIKDWRNASRPTERDFGAIQSESGQWLCQVTCRADFWLYLQ